MTDNRPSVRVYRPGTVVRVLIPGAMTVEAVISRVQLFGDPGNLSFSYEIEWWDDHLQSCWLYSSQIEPLNEVQASDYLTVGWSTP